MCETVLKTWKMWELYEWGKDKKVIAVGMLYVFTNYKNNRVQLDISGVELKVVTIINIWLLKGALTVDFICYENDLY